MLFVRHFGLMAFILWLGGCGTPTSSHQSTIHGAVRDQSSGFYLNETDELGLQWITFCDKALTDQPAQWSECMEVSVLDPALATQNYDQIILEQLITIPIIEGTLSLDDLTSQINTHILNVAAIEQEQETAKSLAIGSGLTVAGQLGISKALDLTNPNIILRQGYGIQKFKIWGGKTINLIPKMLTNMHMRYFLASIANSKLILGGALTLAVVGAGLFHHKTQQYHTTVTTPKLADTKISIYDLARAFLNHSDEVVVVEDAQQTLETLLSGLDLSADIAIFFRLHQQQADDEDEATPDP